MNRIFVGGLGAVTPAGWGLAALRKTIEENHPLATQTMARPGWQKLLRVREVPPPASRPLFFTNPRFRRASAITYYGAGAAMEALHQAGVAPGSSLRLGLVMCVLSGGVQYTQRFFEEALKDPATASPLLFPETVFNAPASHLAALWGRPLVTYTLLGDPATFLQGLALASEWLIEGRVDGCLVVGAEEINWVLADVLWQFDHQPILTGGAGALYLTRSEEQSLGVELSQITEPQVYCARLTRSQAAQNLRRLLPAGHSQELLCDGLGAGSRLDKAEKAAWSDWPGIRWSPKTLLGEGLMAAGAWQCVLAGDALARHLFPAANVSLVGINQQAIGLRFIRTHG